MLRDLVARLRLRGGGGKGEATRKLYHRQPLPGQLGAWSLPAVGGGHFPELWSRGALLLAAAAATTATEWRRLTGGHGFYVWAGKRKRRLWSPPPPPPPPW